MSVYLTVIPDNVICHPELVSGSSRLGRSRNEFGMTGLKGFTLIELLVVISIIAILSAVGFVSYQEVRGKALQAKYKGDLDAIRKAYEAKYDPTVDNGQGGYKPLEDKDFASGKIPTPNGEGTSYFVSGPNSVDPPATAPNFALCALLKTGASCPSLDCICATSTQGTPVDPSVFNNVTGAGSSPSPSPSPAPTPIPTPSAPPACTPTDSSICGTKNCGSVTGMDNCNVTRTVTCGTCSGATPTCTNNVCVAASVAQASCAAGIPVSEQQVYSTSMVRCGKLNFGTSSPHTAPQSTGGSLCGVTSHLCTVSEYKSRGGSTTAPVGEINNWLADRMVTLSTCFNTNICGSNKCLTLSTNTTGSNGIVTADFRAAHNITPDSAGNCPGLTQADTVYMWIASPTDRYPAMCCSN